MLRVHQHLFRRALLDDLAAQHHGDRVGDVPCEAKVVRDDEGSEAELLAQLEQQTEDLSSDGCVE